MLYIGVVIKPSTNLGLFVATQAMRDGRKVGLPEMSSCARFRPECLSQRRVTSHRWRLRLISFLLDGIRYTLHTGVLPYKLEDRSRYLPKIGVKILTPALDGRVYYGYTLCIGR